VKIREDPSMVCGVKERKNAGFDEPISWIEGVGRKEKRPRVD